jgi:hypothetical protein
MTLAQILKNCAKKGADYFAFQDGLRKQHSYYKTAFNIGSSELQKDVLIETVKQYSFCALAPAFVHSIIYCATPLLIQNGKTDQSIWASAIIFSCATEIFRYGSRVAYNLENADKFAEQLDFHLHEEPRFDADIISEAKSLERRITQ